MPTVAPRTVLGDITVALSNQVPGTTASMRSRAAVSWAIQREHIKKKGHSKPPTSFEDLLTLREKFMETADKHPFLAVNEALHPWSFLTH